MKIGELVKASGLSKDAIRHYEELGLLTGITRPNEYNNYKEYPVKSVYTLEFIEKMKTLGFTLKEIKSVIDLIVSGGMNEDQGRKLLTDKIDVIDQKIKSLQSIKSDLLKFLNTMDHTECEEAAERDFAQLK